MPNQIFFTDQYEKQLQKIENFILESTESLDQVSSFLDEHDKVLNFLLENPETAAVHPSTGDQSWPFADGRYRVFFKGQSREAFVDLYMIVIIDNRQANFKIYPGNSLRTYYEED